MKKIVNCIIVVLIVSSFICYRYKSRDIFPCSTPSTDVIVNSTRYKTVQGDGNWFLDKIINGSVCGSSYIVDMDKELTEKCLFIEVKSGDTLRFDISYKDNIKAVTLYNVDFKDSKRKQNALILTEEYSFKAPEKKGEYYYAFNVTWDNTHNSDYLFKIKVI